MENNTPKTEITVGIKMNLPTDNATTAKKVGKRYEKALGVIIDTIPLSFLEEAAQRIEANPNIKDDIRNGREPSAEALAALTGLPVGVIKSGKALLSGVGGLMGK